MSIFVEYEAFVNKHNFLLTKYGLGRGKLFTREEDYPYSPPPPPTYQLLL